jgi:hypothetical protein
MEDEKKEELKEKGEEVSEESSEGEESSKEEGETGEDSEKAEEDKEDSEEGKGKGGNSEEEEVDEEKEEEAEDNSEKDKKEEDSEEDNSNEENRGEVSGGNNEDGSRIGGNNEEKESPVKKIHYLIVGIVLVALVFVYANGGSVSGDVVLENHLEGICDDPEGDENDFYAKGEVKAGSDDTGRVGFTDTCLKTFYDGRLDDIGLAFYFRSLAEYGAIDEEMTKDMDILFEGYCPESLTQTFEEVDPFMLIATYKCPNGCEDGACIS